MESRFSKKIKLFKSNENHPDIKSFKNLAKSSLRSEDSVLHNSVKDHKRVLINTLWILKSKNEWKH